MSYEKIPVNDMECASCEAKIEKALRMLEGVVSVRASYVESLVRVEYDSALCDREMIYRTIQDAGYGTKAQKGSNSTIGIFIIFLAILLLGDYTGGFDMSSELKGEVSYFLLFVIGLFTSLHCIGMCGGIMLSQTITPTDSRSRLVSALPAILYNTGRVISYTVLGGIIGAIGSVFSVSISFMAGMSIVAGLFMILMGLNLAGFSIFRKYLRIPIPAFLRPSDKPRAPFVVGLLNGLLPCGPLQTMQLYTLTTGGALQGATAMFIFALGTLPLMLSFGAITSFLSKTHTKRIMKFSGVLVILLGLVMANRGLVLAGINLPGLAFFSQNTAAAAMITKAEIKDGAQIVRIAASNQGYAPNVLYVQKGIPVKWIIDGQQINSCNNEIIVPSQNLKKKLTSGENVIEFTPDAADMNFSCWMGMIKGVIKVVDDLNAVDVSKVNVAIPSTSGCCSSSANSNCCARPEPKQSIYGDDYGKVPTDRLIRKASRSDDRQSFSVKGKGYELEPLIFVITKQIRTKVIFDLTAFDKPEGVWEVIDYKEKAVIASFQGKQGMTELELGPREPGKYGIFKDGVLLGIIEAVDDSDIVNLESIRANYL